MCVRARARVHVYVRERERDAEWGERLREEAFSLEFAMGPKTHRFLHCSPPYLLPKRRKWEPFLSSGSRSSETCTTKRM